MASKVDWSNLQGFKQDKVFQKPPDPDKTILELSDDYLITIEATCPTGFEVALVAEIKERFPTSVTVKHQGRVFFDLPISQVENIIKLRCMDNAWVLIGVRKTFDFTGDVETCLQRINSLLDDNICDSDNTPLAWEKGLIAWNKIAKFKDMKPHDEKNCLSLLSLPNMLKTKVPSNENEQDDRQLEKESMFKKESTMPTFRATCYRSGENCHPFGSMDVARAFGGAINDKFGWGVKMKGFDLDVLITIDITQVYVGISLTKESLFKRNIEHFGPTTLRATICASLLQLANIQPGEIVVDPMCGGASIPIEGAIAFKQGFHIGGDNHDKAVTRSADNFKSLSDSLTKASNSSIYQQLPGDIIQWDVTKIPLRNNSVDVFVTDLPFGKRSGSKADNRVLYPKIMNSMARVVKPSTGRAVVLTQDKTSMFKAQGKFNKFWKVNRQHYCNIGGLAALVFIMSRTEKVCD